MFVVDASSSENDIADARQALRRSSPLFRSSLSLHLVLFFAVGVCSLIIRLFCSVSASDKAITHPDLVGKPLLVFFNKQDLRDARTTDRLWKLLDLESLSQAGVHVHTEESSAITGVGIEDGLAWLSSRVTSSG